MEFTNFKCPVCGKGFENGDDVVVCPECGAPHHRSCFESLGSCYYSDRHGADFSFEDELSAADAGRAEVNGSDAGQSFENSEAGQRPIVCPSCKNENSPGSMYCNRCGFPIGRGFQNGGSRQNTHRTGFAPDPAAVMFDPLAGMKPEEEIADGIKVSEMAKFVGKNTQYFLLVFKKIRELGRSRFNFASFLLPGIYLLYRKMTVPGLIVSLILIASNVVSTYIYLTPEWSAYYNEIMNVTSGGLSGSSLDPSLFAKMLFVYLPVLLSGIRYVMMLLCGLFTNRRYRAHCVKKITAIKQQNDPQNHGERLEKAGGVNLGLAISLGAATLIVGYVCNFFMIQAGLIF